MVIIDELLEGGHFHWAVRIGGVSAIVLVPLRMFLNALCPRPLDMFPTLVERLVCLTWPLHILAALAHAEALVQVVAKALLAGAGLECGALDVNATPRFAA